MTDISNTDLFEPVQVGSLKLRNRIAMAPLTRSRAGSAGIPGEMVAEYYAQRATAGLLISEATNISLQGRGYAYTPGIFNEEQIAGWKLVTDAVHAKGGAIVCQLWHVGRISHPSLQPNGGLPVAPSAIKAEGQAYTEHGFEPFVEPRALRLDEMDGLMEQYRNATLCAQKAGFDGVEIHAANGYLIDQFLKDKTNTRTDAYGGSIENRTRFMVEVVDTVVKAWSADKVGIRLSPYGVFNGTGPFADVDAQYKALAEGLSSLGLLYVHVLDHSAIGAPAVPAEIKTALRAAFDGPFILAGVKTDAITNELDMDSFYTPGAKGYTDYPAQA